ncbi:CRISPR-associated helicase Cas3' [Ruminiclostridium josui]|uniref:CRISPR-associated helicase Cas3' n=1 Tax=Ruminiclostridium josui TaxID=1499 RepID=UPI0006CF8C65|nr:CRISPR-associated helicase Cas3' [Ruminiclostridium josui]
MYFNTFFSSLICFDKLDSAGIYRRQQEKLPTISNLDAYILKKSAGRKSNLQTQRNEIKCKVLETIDKLSDEELKSTRIFTFTAPTGAGKTLTSVAAELRLAERLKNIYGVEPNIIVAIPFVNILEQTKEDYNSIFKNVLVHHSLSNMKEYKESDMTNLHEKELLTDTWESNVIMTTFVQFFESILTAKNNKLMKLNKMSGSIVVLDEIQSLPFQYYPLLGAVIKKISDYYGIWFILMTATQPKIIDYANMLLDNSKMSAIELLQDERRYFTELERTMLIPCFDKLYEIDDIAKLIHKTKPCDKNALVVVNTIAYSIDLYNKLTKDGHRVLYLSTNLISVDRKKVIEECQKLIKDRVPFILVSTQTIEAGVDLDFDIGYRDLAPLESIIQVAGRVNRNGKKNPFSPVYVFESGKGTLVYKFYRIDKTKKYLNRNIPENEYVDLVESYYSELLEDKSYDREIWEGIEKLNYEVVSKFRLIDEQFVQDVIIEIDDDISMALENYCKLRKEYSINKSYEIRDKIKQTNKLINQYTVKVRTNKLVQNMPWRFDEVYSYIDAPYLIVPKPNVSQFYNATGFISENKDAFMY